jgi:hypothetical protein
MRWAKPDTYSMKPDTGMLLTAVSERVKCIRPRNRLLSDKRNELQWPRGVTLAICAIVQFQGLLVTRTNDRCNPTELPLCMYLSFSAGAQLLEAARGSPVAISAIAVLGGSLR